MSLTFSRRAVLGSTVALAAGCDRPVALPEQDQSLFGAGIAGQGALLPIRGTELYVEVAGETSAPTVLYLHGGPGAGSYDFSVFQGARLAQRLRVIMLDQRGVLRSAALAEGDPCTMGDLVEDIEAVRDALGVRSWAVIGHSFGGYLALSYALAHPGSVDRVVFENPCLDLGSSARELTRGAAEIYARLGDQANAQACLDAAAADADTRTTWERFGELVNTMPERDSLYVHGPEKNFFGDLVASSEIPRDNWGRGGTHQRKLFEEGAVFQSLLPRLSELTKPALFIHGAYDRVGAPDQIAAFNAGPNRSVVNFENSAHFAHFEEQERFAEEVANFVSG
jgi:proline iminopeptidase